MKTTLSSKPVLLFLVLAGFFVTNALVAEFIGMKIFAFEPTLGLPLLEWKLFGQSGSLMLSAGVLLWPVVFVTTDLINEYFGKRAVRFLSWMMVGLISYAFLMVFLAIELVPAEFWKGDYQAHGVPDMQAAFSQVFGQGLQIIVGSLLAFLIGQIVDAAIFHRLRMVTG
ncbi:MAG: queuosine precursor transporter, partial [Bacteroidota bacterium]